MRSAVDKGAEVARKTGVRLAVSYAFAAFAWIIITDALLFLWNPPPGLLATISSGKGTAFVLFTAGALYMLSAGYLRRIHISEERHRSLFENATEGLLLFRVRRDVDFAVSDIVLEDMNPVQARRMEVERRKMTGASMKRPRPDELGLEPYFDAVREALGSGTPMSSELTLPDGSIQLLATYTIDEDVWVVACMDVTELRRAQWELEEQEARIRGAYVDVLDAVTGGKLVLLTDAELDAELGEPLSPEYIIDSPSQLSAARQRVSRAIEPISSGGDSYDLLGPVGEALNNALKHAGSGFYQVFKKEGVVQVAVSDTGPGIDFKTLPKAALQSGFSTTATLGMGFTIMMQLSERVLLMTQPGRTTVVLESRLLEEGAAAKEAETMAGAER